MMKNNKGFMLLEVLLAIAVLSMGIVVLYSTISRSLQMAELSRDRLKASLVLEGRVWDFENNMTSKPEKENMDLRNIQWQTERIKGQLAQHWNISLSWQTRSRKEDLTLTAFLYKEE